MGSQLRTVSVLRKGNKKPREASLVLLVQAQYYNDFCNGAYFA